MVGTSTIIAVIITMMITLILPLVVYIVYGITNKKKGVWTAWLLGAAGFFVLQVIIRLPILNVVSLIPGFQTFVENNYILYCLVLAFTAGLFEVIGRYAVAKIMRKNLTFKRGIAAGLGHGGIESMVIVGMTYVSNLLYITMINNGSFDLLLEQTAAMGVETDSLIVLRDTLISTPATLYYLGGYERVLTVIAHTFMSLLVCYFVWKKKDALGIGICLIFHTALDFLSGMLSSLSTKYLGEVISRNMGYVLTYTFLTVVAVLSVIGILKIKKQWTESLTQK